MCRMTYGHHCKLHPRLNRSTECRHLNLMSLTRVRFVGGMFDTSRTSTCFIKLQPEQLLLANPIESESMASQHKPKS